MGSCAAPSAKGDDKFITTDYLQQCHRQQIKTFRLKYVFLAAKIIKTARYVIMKLSENYPYKGVYEKCLV
ncbi:hypothetical protein EGS88_01025 [Escherichia coli]|nr:hypothetical protein EGS88_01025 [Escherichia coli]